MRYQMGIAPERERTDLSRAYRYENSRPYSVFALAFAAAAAVTLMVAAISGGFRAFDIEPKEMGIWASPAVTEGIKEPME